MPIEIVALDRGFRSTMLLWAHDRFVGSDLCLDSHVSKMWSADDLQSEILRWRVVLGFGVSVVCFVRKYYVMLPK